MGGRWSWLPGSRAVAAWRGLQPRHPSCPHRARATHLHGRVGPILPAGREWRQPRARPVDDVDQPDDERRRQHRSPAGPPRQLQCRGQHDERLDRRLVRCPGDRPRGRPGPHPDLHAREPGARCPSERTTCPAPSPTAVDSPRPVVSTSRWWTRPIRCSQASRPTPRSSPATPPARTLAYVTPTATDVVDPSPDVTCTPATGDHCRHRHDDGHLHGD